ncbi:Hypp6368 [Branchiostoma lanceolatum]|uniref:Hypp6368 protein n=1 Tax=Branchiostoma lanceolatum TaxID=7740 RepID=A0A8J9YTK0_BRALA|nr:Hypp6368 [Branchiostoma lanceolatum]
MTSKQEDRETTPPSNVVGYTLDDFSGDSSIGCLTDNNRYGHYRGYVEGVLESTVGSSDSNSAQTKESRAIYDVKESVESEDIYVADNNEAQNAVTYQSNETCRKEASADVYECGEDIDDIIETRDATTTDNDGIQQENVISDATNTDIDGTQPTNVTINRLADGGESAHHDGVDVSEWISPYAVAYSQYGHTETQRRDHRNLTDDLLQPYAVVYDDGRNDEQASTRRFVGNARGVSAKDAVPHSSTGRSTFT